MGKLSVISSGPLATIQDRGRFGYRKFGIPQSGAMDPGGMKVVNHLVGNPDDAPVIEFALSGWKLEALEDTHVGAYGAALKIDGRALRSSAILLSKGSVLEVSPPWLAYGYLAIGGVIEATHIFGSFSTYLPGKFGGINGRSLKKHDLIKSRGQGKLQSATSRRTPDGEVAFRIGPEWHTLEHPFRTKSFTVDPSSNRIGIRLMGTPMRCKEQEIKSSAVIPGTIQLPPNGQPIVLMNDCQTTGGYPRIGKVLEEDLWKLAQTKAGEKVTLTQVS